MQRQRMEKNVRRQRKSPQVISGGCGKREIGERDADNKQCPLSPGAWPTGMLGGSRYTDSDEQKCLSADFASYGAYPIRASHSLAS